MILENVAEVLLIIITLLLIDYLLRELWSGDGRVGGKPQTVGSLKFSEKRPSKTIDNLQKAVLYINRYISVPEKQSGDEYN